MSVKTMSAFAPADDQRPLVSPRARLYELTTNGDFATWELHSELVLVCPELRRQSLALLPDPEAVAQPAAAVVEPPLPLRQVAPLEEPTSEPDSLLGFAVRQVAAMTRLGLQIIGAIVLLLLLTESFVH